MDRLKRLASESCFFKHQEVDFPKVGPNPLFLFVGKRRTRRGFSCLTEPEASSTQSGRRGAKFVRPGRSMVLWPRRASSLRCDRGILTDYPCTNDACDPRFEDCVHEASRCARSDSSQRAKRTKKNIVIHEFDYPCVDTWPGRP